MPSPQPEILFLVHRAPWPPDRGDRIRSWHMFEALRKVAPVHVAALADNERDATIARDRLTPLTKSLFIAERTKGRFSAMASALGRGLPASIPLFHHDGMAAHVDGLIRSGTISHIVVFSSQMAQYVPPRSDFGGPVIMDFVDVDSAKFAAYGAADGALSPMGWVHRREGRLLAAYEKATAERADTSLFVSAAEAALFRDQSGISDGRVIALENGIDLDRFSPDGDWQPLASHGCPASPIAVFTGQMDYRPNISAVSHFARAILPRLRTRMADTTFAIVGRAPTAEVLALAKLPGVMVTGEVPDTRPWLAAADAVVAPLVVARGVQNKLLEAMAMARPVVASAAAAQGIDAQPGRDLIVADGVEATVAALTALFADTQRGWSIGNAARARMVARYGWAATLAPLAAILGLATACGSV